MPPAQTTLAEALLLLDDIDEQRRFVEERATEFSEADFQAVKEAADKFLRANLERSRRLGHLLLALAHNLDRTPDSHPNNDPAPGHAAAGDLPRALGIVVRANASGISGIGEFARAVRLYDRAAQLYARLGRARDQARSQIGKIYCLGQLSRFQETEETERWARQILEAEQDWVGLSRLTSNLGIAYSRMGDELRSLKMFNDARDYCLRAGEHLNSNLPNIEHNRSFALRNLGRFEESIEAIQAARSLHLAAGSPIEAARAQQTLATIYFVQGRYNEALADLDQVRDIFLGDERTRDAMRVDLYISDCLLQLRRFNDVLHKCRQVRAYLTSQGVQYEVAQAILNEAVAYAGLHQYQEAEDAVAQARSLFVDAGNNEGVAYAELQQATLLQHRHHFTASVEVARQCGKTFGELEKPVETAYSHLVAARGLLALNELADARQAANRALAIGQESQIPALTYACRHMLANIAHQQGDSAAAFAEYETAMDALEHLRGRLMLEFRAAFIEDKQSVYEDAVLLCLEINQAALALEYAERAKSRTLIDLLAQRLDLRVEARSPADEPLLNELNRLRSQRDQIYRQWEGSNELRSTAFATRSLTFQQAQLAVAELEQRITELWHTLLIRNAAYARDAALWRTRSEPFQPLLAQDTLLLEYFVARDRLIVFLVTHDGVESRQLAVESQWLQQTLRLLRLNMSAVPTATMPQQIVHFEAQARRILQQLYDALLRPLGLAPQNTGLQDRDSDGASRRFAHLVIVPHGPLHYLPFHALHTGSRYLLEEFEISYLPSASFLHYCHVPAAERSQQQAQEKLSFIAFGNSANGQLPYAVAEAQAVAQRMGGRAFVEGDATKTRLSEIAPQASILHVAAHADFRGDNPLFSGLSLADGWLTTLDIFDLKARLALATLSACQTGRSVIGGGDELLGLMRAWISAGAASLVLSYWPVEDRSAARLMEHFYAALAAGQSKAAALRAAQLDLLGSHAPHSHPYFWAAYYLVGDSGPI